MSEQPIVQAPEDIATYLYDEARTSTNILISSSTEQLAEMLQADLLNQRVFVDVEADALHLTKENAHDVFREAQDRSGLVAVMKASSSDRALTHVVRWVNDENMTISSVGAGFDVLVHVESMEQEGQLRHYITDVMVFDQKRHVWDIVYLKPNA